MDQIWDMVSCDIICVAQLQSQWCVWVNDSEKTQEIISVQLHMYETSYVRK
ncbi:hypothetical protein RhiirC2_753052, partial [Rhizophagus irregularis]